LHIRVDVVSHDAWLCRAERRRGAPRGNGSIRIPLEFVRFEPYVIPRKSLTGDSTERVDTRVLQVSIAFGMAEPSVYVVADGCLYRRIKNPFEFQELGRTQEQASEGQRKAPAVRSVLFYAG